MEAIEEQVKIMGRNKSILEMGSLMNYQLAEEWWNMWNFRAKIVVYCILFIFDFDFMLIN